MKKLFLLILALAAITTTNAQVFVENFVTAPVNGNLEGYNGWYVSLKSGDNYGVSPKIGEDPLFYTGYPGSNIGHVAMLDSAIGATSATQRISTKKIAFAPGDTLKASATGLKIYSAFIVNVNPVSYRSYRDFFNYEGSSTSSMTRGRVFAKNNTAGTEVLFAVTKNSSGAVDLDAASTTTLGLTLSTGTNHLLVLKYEVFDGTSNDILTLYVNPDLSKTEAEQTNKLTAPDAQTDYSAGAWLGINLRQRGIGAQVGGIRVGRSWDTVVLGLTSGLNQLSANNRIFAYDKTIITNEVGILKIYNLSGAEVLSTTTNGKYESTLGNGLYLAKFINLNGVTSTGKIQLK